MEPRSTAAVDLPDLSRRLSRGDSGQHRTRAHASGSIALNLDDKKIWQLLTEQSSHLRPQVAEPVGRRYGRAGHFCTFHLVRQPWATVIDNWLQHIGAQSITDGAPTTEASSMATGRRVV